MFEKTQMLTFGCFVCALGCQWKQTKPQTIASVEFGVSAYLLNRVIRIISKAVRTPAVNYPHQWAATAAHLEKSNNCLWDHTRQKEWIYLTLKKATAMNNQTIQSSTSANLKSERDLTSRFIKIVRPDKSVNGVVKSTTASRSDVTYASGNPISALWSNSSRTIPFHLPLLFLKPNAWSLTS